MAVTFFRNAEIVWDPTGRITGRFDKVALNENRLLFISLVAFSQDIKALRAAFATGLDCPI